MKVYSGKDLCKIAKEAGWEHIRTKGSHWIFIDPDDETNTSVILTIPVHGNKSMKKGLQEYILKIIQSKKL